MYQIIGKMCKGFKLGIDTYYVLYNFDKGKIIVLDKFNCTCTKEMYGKIINLGVRDTITDGSIDKLPVYNADGTIMKNRIPVILERVVLDGEPVGYTIISENGVYERYKTEDLIKRYKEFFNAKVVTKDGKSFISAKRGTFPEIDIKKYSRKVNSVAEKMAWCSDAPDYNSFVCRKSDYVISDGILYKYNGKDKKIRIPEGVKHIAKDAFCWFDKTRDGDTPHISTVEEVILPSSYEGKCNSRENELIDCFTFYNYYKPKNVYVADENMHFSSKNGIVFRGCMGTLAFYPNKQDSAYKVPDSVYEIAFGAFNYSIYLKELTLSKHLHSIDYSIDEDDEEYEEYLESLIYGNKGLGNIIYGCSSLTNIYVAEGNQFYKSIDGVLYSKRGLFLRLYPTGRKGAYTIPKGVQYIDIFAFCGCNGLTEVKFSDTVKVIYTFAFLSCDSLKEVTIPSTIECVKGYAFECKNIEDVTVLGMETEVPEDAFDFFKLKLHCLKGSDVDKEVGFCKEKIYIGGKE